MSDCLLPLGFAVVIPCDLRWLYGRRRTVRRYCFRFDVEHLGDIVGSVKLEAIATDSTSDVQRPVWILLQ